MNPYNLLAGGKRHCCSVIGMAKNTGKTTTLNYLADRAVKAGEQPALVSYGRDGEEQDVLTKKPKPPITIPGGGLFATLPQLAGPPESLEIFGDPEIETVCGQVLIYRNTGASRRVELMGINRLSQLESVLGIMKKGSRIILIDGALGRRSSAMPVLSDSLFLATGAAVSNTLESVIKKTASAVRRLTCPESESPFLVSARKAMEEGRQIVIGSQGDIREYSGLSGFSTLKEIPLLKEGDLLVFRGAFTDRLAQAFLNQPACKNMEIMIQDGTRLFLSDRIMTRFQQRNIHITARHTLNLQAVTCNPWSPYSTALNPRELVDALKEAIPGIPVYDIVAHISCSSSKMPTPDNDQRDKHP